MILHVIYQYIASNNRYIYDELSERVRLRKRQQSENGRAKVVVFKELSVKLSYSKKKSCIV